MRAVVQTLPTSIPDIQESCFALACLPVRPTMLISGKIGDKLESSALGVKSLEECKREGTQMLPSEAANKEVSKMLTGCRNRTYNTSIIQTLI